MPGTGPAPVVVGPEPATAAEVLASIERAYLNGTFVHGIAIVRDLVTPADSGEWANVDGVEMPPGSYMERRSTFYEAADGSSRVDEPDEGDGRWATSIYNASLRTSWIYAPEWSGDNEWAAETAFLDTGTAAGPPDWYSNFVGVYGYAGFALAAAAAPDAKVTGTVYDGRPAWVLTCSVNPGPVIETGPDESTSYRQVDRIAVTVDEETGYPLRVRESFKGDMWRETRVEDFEVLSSVPDDLFEYAFPEDAEVESQDLGFREIALEDAGAEAGYSPVAPTWLPADFALRQATFADASEIPVPGEQGIRPDYDAFRSTDVVSARYGEGFLNVTVTTRRLENPRAAKRGDPFDGVDRVLHEVRGAAAEGQADRRRLQGQHGEHVHDRPRPAAPLAHRRRLARDGRRRREREASSCASRTRSSCCETEPSGPASAAGPAQRILSREGPR